MAYNESNAPRFAQAVARMHDIKGNPAPQVTPEISHSVTLEQVSFGYELEILTGRRNCFAGITAPAIAAVSSGVLLQVPTGANFIAVVTGVQVQKAVAGFVSIQFDNVAPAGTYATSFAFFRDMRMGPTGSARPSTQALTHLTGGLPGGVVLKRVFLPANTFVQ